MPVVLNKHKHYVLHATYIGRGSAWGNPYRIGVDGDRNAVTAKFDYHLASTDALFDRLDELAGQDLCCYCNPSKCHGDSLLYLSNAGEEERKAWRGMILAKPDPR